MTPTFDHRLRWRSSTAPSLARTTPLSERPEALSPYLCTHATWRFHFLVCPPRSKISVIGGLFGGFAANVCRRTYPLGKVGPGLVSIVHLNGL